MRSAEESEGTTCSSTVGSGGPLGYLGRLTGCLGGDLGTGLALIMGIRVTLTVAGEEEVAAAEVDELEGEDAEDEVKSPPEGAAEPGREGILCGRGENRVETGWGGGVR